MYEATIQLLYTDERQDEQERSIDMLPLSFGVSGDQLMVRQVGGSDDVKQHLGDLGFVPGAVVHVISSHNGDMIVDLKGTKLAITREMASKIKTDKLRDTES